MSFISLENAERNRDERSVNYFNIHIHIYIYICICITRTIYNSNPVEQFLINLKDIAFIKYVDMPVVLLSRKHEAIYAIC
jgi:hypothetical protein